MLFWRIRLGELASCAISPKIPCSLVAPPESARHASQRSLSGLYGCRSTTLRLLVPEFDKLLGVLGKRNVVGPRVAPDAARNRERLIGDRTREALEDNVPIVTDIDQRIEDAVEIDGSRAKVAAIAFTDVEITDFFAREPDGHGRIDFFDVHMKGVEVQADMLRTRPLDEVEPLLRCVQEIRFEAIDDLKHEFDASLFGDVRGLGDRGDAVLSPLVGRHLRVFAMRRIKDAA